MTDSISVDTVLSLENDIILHDTLSHNILPPPVPDFIPGEFAYVVNGRDYLQDAYRVISINEWWEPFKQYVQTKSVSNTTGFTFTQDPFYRTIMNAISGTPIGGGHSGYSIGFCMRVMEEIALDGEANYRDRYIATYKQ